MPKRSFVIIILFSTVLASLVFTGLNSQSDNTVTAQTQTPPQWPMAGHDNQRTSWAPESLGGLPTKPLWHKRIDPYIPSKAQLVTLLGNGTRPDLVFVPTSKGVYAFRADAQSIGPGRLNQDPPYWFYPTSMPVGHSPTIVGDIMYISSFDKTIHAVNVNTGAKIKQTAQAGAGFDTSPLVANNKVYAGNRDGYLYAFNTSDLSLAWSFKTGGPVSYSPAISTDNQAIYFASNDSFAYAINAITGALIWKSAKLPGDGFYSYWPVVNGNNVLFAGTNNYERLQTIQTQDAFGSITQDSLVCYSESSCPLPDGRLNAQRFTNYLKANPTRRTFFVFDRLTGVENPEYAPFLWVGNWSGNSYPPAIGPDGIVYVHAMWKKLVGDPYLKGRVAGWQMGTSLIRPLPDANSELDSQDEYGAISIIGPSQVYYNHKEDQYGGIYNITGGSNESWDMVSNLTDFPNYYQGNSGGLSWEDRKYGNLVLDASGIPKGLGTHGNANPSVPLRNKVFFHMSNAIVAFGI